MPLDRANSPAKSLPAKRRTGEPRHRVRTARDAKGGGRESNGVKSGSRAHDARR